MNKDANSYIDILAQAHEACCQFDNAYEETFTIMLDYNVKSLFKQMQKCVEYAPDGVGLERYAVRSLHHDMKIRIAEFANLVCEIQNEQNQSRHCMVEQDENEKILQRHCERISLPSRRMAYFLAKAQQEPSLQ